jgi:hypothetical protein
MRQRRPRCLKLIYWAMMIFSTSVRDKPKCFELMELISGERFHPSVGSAVDDCLNESDNARHGSRSTPPLP